MTVRIASRQGAAGVTGGRTLKALLPAEHGAWIVLAVSLCTGAAVARPSVGDAALACVAVLAAYLATDGLAKALRPRPPRGALAWLAGWSAAAGLSAGGLVVGLGRVGLVGIALVALALAAAPAWGAICAARRRPSNQARLDRTTWGEALGAAALASSSAVMVVVARGRVDVAALALWLAMAAHFAGAVLRVRVRLLAFVMRDVWSPAVRRRLTAPVVAYHASLALVATASWLTLGSGAGGYWVAAFALPTARALLEATRLSCSRPLFGRMGAAETGLAVWFAVFATAGWHALGW